MMTSAQAAEQKQSGPPSELAVSEALTSFIARVADRYGTEYQAAFLYGSRARGDYLPCSDADLLLVFRDGSWSPWARTMELAEMAFDEILAHHVDIQPVAVAESRWTAQSTDPFLNAVKSEARSIDAHAFVLAIEGMLTTPST